MFDHSSTPDFQPVLPGSGTVRLRPAGGTYPRRDDRRFDPRTVEREHVHDQVPETGGVTIT